ncbi:chemokine-like receptor 1 [Rhinatrema bivittatum]|uniref:chemokine-like receptor 1 n=1 Tax=Rhinatrema bivittatum TaxID=194408 RepID=UPI001129946B|nr:chemokine-like receptor 1 [Rhinatrema bivittatum]XP_029433233.1 chemokine-like receptor 1 [Rhinatrema bivittatum]
MEMSNITTLMENTTFSFTIPPTLMENATYSLPFSPTLMANTTFMPSSRCSTTLRRKKRPFLNGNRCSDFSSIAESMRILSIVIYSIALIFGVMGNSLVIWITGYKMKKTVNTVWFLNLAIADFIFTFFLPLPIIQAAMSFHWPFGKFLCKINSMIGIVNMYASIFFLTVISVDRCMSVVFPVWSQNHRTPRLATIIALTTWCLAILFSLPAPIFRDTQTYPNNVTTCFSNYALSTNTSIAHVAALKATRHKAITIIRFLFGFFIPFLVIAACYGIITVLLQKNRLVARSRKPFRIIIAVIMSFFICWFPFHVFAFLELSLHQGSTCQLQQVFRIGMPIATSLTFLNSCVNPILYVFMGRDAQTSIQRSFFLTFENAFKEVHSQVTYSSRNQSKSMTEVESRFL